MSRREAAHFRAPLSSLGSDIRPSVAGIFTTTSGRQKKKKKERRYQGTGHTPAWSYRIPILTASSTTRSRFERKGAAEKWAAKAARGKKERGRKGKGKEEERVEIPLPPRPGGCPWESSSIDPDRRPSYAISVWRLRKGEKEGKKEKGRGDPATCAGSSMPSRSRQGGYGRHSAHGRRRKTSSSRNIGRGEKEKWRREREKGKERVCRSR